MIVYCHLLTNEGILIHALNFSAQYVHGPSIIQIRSQNQFIWSNWSEPIVLQRNSPTVTHPPTGIQASAKHTHTHYTPFNRYYVQVYYGNIHSTHSPADRSDFPNAGESDVMLQTSTVYIVVSVVVFVASLVVFVIVTACTCKKYLHKKPKHENNTYIK